MDSAIFNDLLKHYQSNFVQGESWASLAKKYGYANSEIIRASFKRERKKLGIPSKNNKSNNDIKIGVFDIETTPMQVYTFGLWDQNISPEKIIKDSYMLCWSGKFLNDYVSEYGVVTPQESVDGNDIRIVSSIWNFLNKCQIVIGHNIKSFDLKVLNTRFLHYGMLPLNNFCVVDTYLVAKNNFSFPSNSLAYINKFLEIKQKSENDGFNLWKRCMNGDQFSLAKMYEYCKQDVLCTEDLYFKLRPFIKSHPNLGMYFETTESVCPNCGSNKLIEQGFYYTRAGKFASVRCNNCGAVSRKRQNELDKDKKKNLIV